MRNFSDVSNCLISFFGGLVDLHTVPQGLKFGDVSTAIDLLVSSTKNAFLESVLALLNHGPLTTQVERT